MIVLRLATLLLSVTALAATAAPDAAGLAGFELKLVDGVPCGWSATPPGTVSIDETEKHGGSRSLRVVLRPEQAPFTSIARSVPIDAKASTFEVRAHLRA